MWDIFNVHKKYVLVVRQARHFNQWFKRYLPSRDRQMQECDRHNEKTCGIAQS